MPVFSYRAVRADGKRFNGSIETSSIGEAKRLLREQQLIILSLLEAAPEKKKSLTMSFEDRVVFTSQLAQLLSANVPLYESLEALEEQARGESYQPVISSIREHIRTGGSLSSALAAYENTFNPLFRAVISAGESVGRIDQALVRLNELLTAERQSRQRLISALLYPGILFVLLIAAMSVMIFFVIPSIEGLFEGKELPPFTTCVLSIAHFIDHNLWLLIGAGLGSLLFFIYFLRKAKNRERVLTHLLSWPIIGPFLLKSALARFSKTLSNLIDGGTTLSSALPYAKEALGNTVLEIEIERASREIIDGERFSSSIKKSALFPPLFARMITIGEETGRLAPILANISQLYEEDSNRVLDRAVSLLQPILLITMGVIIGTTLLAILLPLADFGTMVSIE